MKKVKRLLFWILIAAIIIFQIYPLFWILSSSIKPAAEHLEYPAYSLPKNPTLENYAGLLDSNIPVYFKNSIIVTIITLVGIVILGALAAYPISKMNFKGRRLIKNFLMVGMMIPIFVSLIPMFEMYNTLGLKNTYWALVIPQVGFAIPMSMYLYCGFFESLPNEMIEAAYIDGANSYRTFFSIVLPLMKNTVATIAVFEFVFVWNEFTFANTFISASNMKTVPVGLNDFINNYGLRDWGSTFAAVFATVLPTLIIFFILNKQVMEGMTAGAVKE